MLWSCHASSAPVGEQLPKGISWHSAGGSPVNKTPGPATSAPRPKLTASTRREGKLTALLEVAKAFSAVRNLDSLLELVMSEATRTVEAERCSLFILDAVRGELWSRVAQGSQEEIRVPLSEGIAGAVARSGEIINLPEAYDDPRFSREWDSRSGFRTKALLCVPMRDTRGEITGVIEALNSTKGGFDHEDEELLSALGGLAAQAIENTMLSEEISRLFEGFVQASVIAIESRDPITAGHSGRVSALSIDLAKAVDASSSGDYASLTFSNGQLQELRYASLLHDFGKIGVREHVLLKAEKLFPEELERLTMRVELAKKDRQLASALRLLDTLKIKGLAARTEYEVQEERRVAKELRELDEILAHVRECNRPTIHNEALTHELERIGTVTYADSKNRIHPLVTPEERAILAIPQGSLTAAERREVELHVTNSFRFLSLIPWTRALKKVPEIAYAHHERIDGSGYPRNLKAQEIPVQAKIIAISDVYDALTSPDRPYKSSMPHVRALDVLNAEVKVGRLDKELTRIFIEAEVSKTALEGIDRF